jgi:hypothetical protein
LAVDINNNFVINPRIDGVIKYCQADNYEITLPYNVYYSEKLIGSYNVNILLQVKRRHVTQVNYLGTLYPFVFDIVDFANEKLINGAELTLPYGYTSSNSAHRFETTFSYLPDYTIGSDIIY